MIPSPPPSTHLYPCVKHRCCRSLHPGRSPISTLARANPSATHHGCTNLFFSQAVCAVDLGKDSIASVSGGLLGFMQHKRRSTASTHAIGEFSSTCFGLNQICSCGFYASTLFSSQPSGCMSDCFRGEPNYQTSWTMTIVWIWSLSASRQSHDVPLLLFWSAGQVMLPMAMYTSI